MQRVLPCCSLLCTWQMINKLSTESLISCHTRVVTLNTHYLQPAIYAFLPLPSPSFFCFANIKSDRPAECFSCRQFVNRLPSTLSAALSLSKFSNLNFLFSLLQGC